jgi:hypothetical protein
MSALQLQVCKFAAAAKVSATATYSLSSSNYIKLTMREIIKLVYCVGSCSSS